MFEISVIALILVLGCFAFFAFTYLRDRRPLRAARYRDRFEYLVNEIERVVIRANKMQVLANQVKDHTLLDHFAAALRTVETLMTAVMKLKTFGEDVDNLSAPLFLVREISEKLHKIESAMKRKISGKPHEFLKVAPVMAQAAIGCHFCSRPFEPTLFGKVRVKVDGNTEEVTACVYCRERLLRTRKARVLFFEEDGEQVHWSKAKSWIPSPEYWDINRDDISGRGKTPHLELVYSNISKISESRQGED
jgi:enamine deaminase RidA (YjgF/YER057c/UK114 family)